MSDISFSPGSPQMPRNDAQARKPGLAAFHTFDEQKEESSSSRNKLIAGVAVAVMFVAVAGYAFEASRSTAPAKPAVSASSMSAPQAVATTPPPAAPAANSAITTPTPAPVANDVAPVVTPPAQVIRSRPAPERVIHAHAARSATGTGGSSGRDNAMQARMSHASDNAPNVTPLVQPALTPDTIAPATAPTSTTATQPTTPTTNASPSTPAPVQTAPATTPPVTTPSTQNPDTQNQTAPSDNPSTN